MSLVLLLEELAARRIELRLEQGRLRYKAPEGALTGELRERLTACREELIAHLGGRPLSEPEMLSIAPAPAQQRLWFIHQLQGPNYTYNIPFTLRLRGPLQPAALRAALDDLVRRHQALRGAFRHDGASLRFEVRRDLRAPWAELDLSRLDEAARAGRLRREATGHARHCFDLSAAPLLRIVLVRLAAAEHVLLLNVHHIAADGWSFGIILREIAAGYEARLAGRAPALPALAWRYSDYIAWQDQLQRQGTMDADLAFWRERLKDAPRCTTPPPDRPRPAVQSFAGGNVLLAVDAATTARLRARARDWAASLNHLTLAATALVIADFSGARDLVIGLPLANRTRRELEPIIGMFVNVVPLRLAVLPDARPAELVAEVKRASTEAMAHCHLPFERLVEETASKRDLSMNPVFQAAYNYLPPLEPLTSFGGLSVDSPDLIGEGAISKYDCTFYLDESDGGLAGHIEYAGSLYRRETAERWARAFATILRRMAEGECATVRDLSGVAAEEHERIEAWRAGPAVPLPPGSPWERFAAIARAMPDDVAVEEAQGSVTFGELARRAGIVSALLAEQGIGPGARVGLLLPRGADHVAAMLGVVRRGAVFVPFEKTQPVDRLARMAAQARLGAVVCQPAEAAAGAFTCARIELDAAVWSGTPAVPDPVPIGHDDPVYMIFTSGSTGVPKAVCVPWRGLCNVVQGSAHAFGRRERVSQIAALSFDASVFEMWPALLRGATLVVVPDELRLDPLALRDWLLRERIAAHFSPTPLAEELLDLEWPAATPLRLLSTGGQALRKRPRPGLPFTVVNNYGPTEVSIVATSGVVAPPPAGAGLPSIGRPIENTRLAVLDDAGHPVPLGTVGELFLAGAGVALGYFDQPEATARSFVTLPGDPALRWYRTGDYVRMLPDGDLEFVGRRDGQVKLRGHRIEVGEIEGEILRVPGVRQAAVRLEGEQLVAYVERGGDGVVEPEGVRVALSRALPAHMIPAHVVLATLPRQSSGKIDLGAVPFFKPEAAPAAAPVEPAGANPLAAAVGRAWASVLQRPAPGPGENFFDAGGHSLMLVRLSAQIRHETGRDIGILDLFRYPTIARQAAFLEGGEAAKPAAPVKRAGGGSAAAGVAIIGLAGRFPRADTVEEFWDNLRAGRDCIEFFSREELLRAGVPGELADRPGYVPANAILRDIDRFDAEFFGLSAREAEIMDPQQRLLLEEAWHAFEDAGYDPARIGGRVGVFVGSSLNGYLIENVLPSHGLVESLGTFATVISNDKDFAATRISYALDLRGPSLSVNSACSTSLVAIHQAVTALRDGQCELALAGGSCVRARQVEGYCHEDGGVLSRDGRCRAFDADASGMVGGSGVAVVLLKPLSAAIADGDHVYAVIKGIAVNNDGSDKVGFTAPGVHGQSRAIRDALERADVDPRTVGYVEAHGTATELGDTIEVAALAENYAPAGGRPAPLRLGSVKTNVGHLDAAAGATGLIKAALCLHRRTFVPSLHFQERNPRIQWPGDAIEVGTRTEPWNPDGAPRRAAVSSLGIGGTNAHAVLEEAPASAGQLRGDGGERPPDAADGTALLLFSGRNEGALRANAAALAGWLERHPGAPLRDVAHTLALGRRHWARRQAVCAARASDVAAAVADLPPAAEPADAVGFMFTGMGPHRPGMARALYGRSPVFTARIDECANILQPILGLDIRRPLLAAPDDAASLALFEDHGHAQPALFTFEYALAEFWIDLGLSPAVLIGHSLGEWVAACVAGVFALPDALRLVSVRGRLMSRQGTGAMVAVNLAESEVAARLPAGLEIAVVNALDQIVVTGPAAEIDAFATRLEAEGIRCKRLQITVAAHSVLVEGACGPLREAVAGVPRSAPDPGRTIISNVTGRQLEADRVRSADYWADHLRRCVRFADGLDALWRHRGLALLECGPSHTLCNLALRDTRRPDARVIVASFDGEDDPEAEWRRLLASAGQLWAAGLPVDVEKLVDLQGRGRRMPLPGYAFQRRRHWLAATPMAAAGPASAPAPAPEPNGEHAAPARPAAGENPVERRVIDIMRELLGPVRLDANSDFFLCGGDSLLAVRLTSRVAEVFKVPATRAQIMGARTPARIAALLGNAGRHDDAGARGAGCVVRLAAGNDAFPPIVLVHAVGGGAFIYGELLQCLAGPHPVYGLQAPGLWDDTAPVDGLRAQAERYHDDLLRAGVRRPVMIGGCSYGGLVAYELDRLYRKGGHGAPLVVLFDSPGPGHMPERLESEAEICAYLLSRDTRGRDFAADLAAMRALDHEGRLARLLEHMRETWMPEAGPEDVARQIRVFRQNLLNMWNWVPEPHDARLVFFKAREQAELLARDPELAWVPLAPAGIEIVPVPGDHSSMLSFPHVRDLARELSRRLPAAHSPAQDVAAR